jgi:hypothetical protein
MRHQGLKYAVSVTTNITSAAITKRIIRRPHTNHVTKRRRSRNAITRRKSPPVRRCIMSWIKKLATSQMLARANVAPDK